MTSSIAIIIPANLRTILAGQSVKLIGTSKPSTLLARLETIFTRPSRIDFTNLSFALAQRAAFKDSLTHFHEHTIITTLASLSEVAQGIEDSKKDFEGYHYGSDVEAVQQYHAAIKVKVSLDAAKKALQNDTLAYGRMVQKANKPDATEDLKHQAQRVKEDLDSRRAVLHGQIEAHKEAMRDAETGKHFAYLNAEEFAAGLAAMDKRDQLAASRDELVASLTHSVSCYAGRLAALSANAIVI